MTVLLDVNVVIALIDPSHVHHDRVHRWFGADGGLDWATCPIVQNGVIRILSQPSYPNALPTPAAAAAIMRDFCAMRTHRFWPDDISLLDGAFFDTDRLLAPAQLTDSYLLALAVRNGGRLATLDRRLSPVAVRDGERHLLLVASGPSKA